MISFSILSSCPLLLYLPVALVVCAAALMAHSRVMAWASHIAGIPYDAITAQHFQTLLQPIIQHFQASASTSSLFSDDL